MSDDTAIEWTDATWNPIVGCSIVSPACTNCYAMAQAARIERMQPGGHYAGTTEQVKGNPVWTGVLNQAPEHILLQPLRWKRPRRIFVNSMSDLFHDAVAEAWIDRIFAVMALAPQHTFQILTKRPKRMRPYCSANDVAQRIAWASVDLPCDDELVRIPSWPLKNVWLGVTAEDQPRADERIPELLETPAAVRFVSIEPMLGPVDLMKIDIAAWLRTYRPDSDIGLHEFDPDMRLPLLMPFYHWQSGYSSPGLDWVICGGESGPRARPMHPQWARDLRDQCKASGVPFFFKQWGEWSPNDYLATDSSRAGFISPDGTLLDDVVEVNKSKCEKPCRLIWRVGKKVAGSLLDGIHHKYFPEIH
jgi:protein gp37